MFLFVQCMVKIFSFSERWNVLFNKAIAKYLSPHENILTIALIASLFFNSKLNFTTE